jgi:molybdopterin-guanine dinucleotide biosynthesis protein B
LRLVAVVGTKASGKTTVVERMLWALRDRDLRTGTLKLIHHEGFTIHAEGRDTARHWEAGADFSIALAPGETAMVRRTDGDHDTMAEIEGIVPADADVLLCEGLVLGGETVRTVVCSRTEEEARSVLGQLPGDAGPVAVSGAVRKSGGAGEVDGLPVLDVTDEGDLRTLAELVLR